MSSNFEQYQADENRSAIRSSGIGRFIRTFVVSFGVSLLVLYGTGFAPAGLSDMPRRVYEFVASQFRTDEAAIIAALPAPSVSTDAIAPTTTPNVAAADTSSALPSADWPVTAVPVTAGAPRFIHVPAAGIRAPIVTPATTDTAALDGALATGIVRYPGSGELGERANVLFFGHSSHLPVVHNPAFVALNGLERVRLGDEILIDTGERQYRYRVYAVRLTTAAEELITFSSTERKLTLSTCNTFGSKSERFVVEALFTGFVPLSSQSPGSLSTVR